MGLIRDVDGLLPRQNPIRNRSLTGFRHGLHAVASRGLHDRRNLERPVEICRDLPRHAKIP